MEGVNSNPYKEQLDSMTWSFSRLNSYHQCPSGWKMQYLDKAEQLDSGFSDWGKLCHSIFEDYGKGILAEYELLDAYTIRYPEYMKGSFPPCRGTPMEEKYCERGKALFASFAGYPENWEILEVERELKIDIKGKKFIGYLDLLVRDKTDGRLILIDHKSKAEFKDENEKQHYAIQLYLYAIWVFEEYHEYPKELLFNMFRVGNQVTIPFNYDDFIAAQEWVCDTIKKIYSDTEFLDKIIIQYQKTGKEVSGYKNDDFFCKYLCGSRNYCVRSGLME